MYISGIAPTNKSGCCNTPTLHIECRNRVACDSREINRLLALGVLDNPNLEAIPRKLAGIAYAVCCKQRYYIPRS
jgi:hypothetical protein